MSSNYIKNTNPDQDPVYEIRIKGHFDSHWKNWFGGQIKTLENCDDTLLIVSIIDQAALHGLLKKVRDLGLILISVIRTSPDKTNELNKNVNKRRIK